MAIRLVWGFRSQEVFFLCVAPLFGRRSGLLCALVTGRDAAEMALVQTFGINVTNARDHCAAQAARTAFQTAGAVLSLIRSLPSVN